MILKTKDTSLSLLVFFIVNYYKISECHNNCKFPNTVCINIINPSVPSPIIGPGALQRRFQFNNRIFYKMWLVSRTEIFFVPTCWDCIDLSLDK